MKNKNPNVVLLMNDSININRFIDNIKSEWGYECLLETEKQERFINYKFEYKNIIFMLSLFEQRFPEDISGDIENSKYSSQGREIYNVHTSFCVLSTLGDNKNNINMLYACFTRIVLSLLLSINSGQCFVYDIKSRQVIDKKMYLKIFDNMKSWYKNNKVIFPIDWYVNYIVYKSGNKYNALTLGLEIFNDYEIEIQNKELNAEDILRIVKYIVINIISKEDKIKNKDLIPIPIGGQYDEGVVKLAKSEVLNRETLTIIF